MLLKVHPLNPQPRLIDKAVDILRNNGVIIYRTDTTYSFGCNINSKKAMNRIYQIKNIDKKQPLTFICSDTKQFEQYTKGISNPIFRKIKSIVPGPYTFIFKASKKVPKIMLSPRETIGVKFPNAPVAINLVEAMEEPVLSSSVQDSEEGYQHPLDLEKKYGKLVDCILDSGEAFVGKSAMIDFSVEPAEIIRSGDADLSWVE